jgi:hypothetical protein
MLETIAASWAKQPLAIEPGVNLRDRMKLTGVNCGFSFLTNDGATRLIVAADALWANSSRATDDREYRFSIR